MSGVFAVTFSIVFAYVADVTDESERSSAYGLVSATFAASLVTSPALGAYLGKVRNFSFILVNHDRFVNYRAKVSEALKQGLYL